MHFLFVALKAVNSVFDSNDGKSGESEASLDSASLEMINKSQKIIEVLCGVLINCTFNNTAIKAIIRDLGVLPFVFDSILPKYLNFYTTDNDTLNIGIIMYCVRLAMITCGNMTDGGDSIDNSAFCDDEFVTLIGNNEMYKLAIGTITMLRDNLKSIEEESATEFLQICSASCSSTTRPSSRR